MKPEYRIKKRDLLNWVIERTSMSKDKDGNEKLTTKDIGFYPRLDHAGMAVYELALKDEHPEAIVYEVLADKLDASRAAASQAVFLAMKEEK